MIVPLIKAQETRTAQEVGRIGENLASYYLEAQGIECSIVDRRGADIWCKTDADNMFTVEVKTASQPISVQMNKYYNFTIRNKKADQFLLTCLDTNLCRIFSREKLLDRVGVKNLFMKPDEFSMDLMKDDLEKLYTFYS
jgi:hypothetical protein|tara:strand:+ start:674 stop:1090 length:417 start_codon:yes stop_codon:yes gene_type:complete